MSSKKPIGGKRNHSRYAHLFREVIRLRAMGKTWSEISAALTKNEGVKVPKTSLYCMWQTRNSGAVKMEGFEAIAGIEKPSQEQDRKHANLNEEAVLGLNQEGDKKKVFQVFQPKKSTLSFDK